jgi:UDPglucose--hexose-1-phosphate uridylyltransferase
MPELRQDPTTKEWIIIATERAKRPLDFRSAVEKPVLPAYDEDCPFCPGHEARTPSESLVRRRSGGEPGWTVRVVPNRFPALVPGGSRARHMVQDYFRKMDGFGYHEVIIETAVHNRTMPLMELDEIEAVLDAYRDRYLTLREDRRLKLILIFKNHGEAAGTSLLHPHSQLVATPVVPGHIRRKYEEAMRYCDATGHCLYCDLLDAERRDCARILLETPHFLIFHPFASQSPFETWIVPRRHQPAYGQIRSEEARDLAGVLKEVLGRMAELLNDPDYNYVIHSSPVDGEDEEYYHWHLEIMPRLTRIAGFEIGAGMRINTAMPEDTACFWRTGRP